MVMFYLYSVDTSANPVITIASNIYLYLELGSVPVRVCATLELNNYLETTKKYIFFSYFLYNQANLNSFI